MKILVLCNPVAGSGRAVASAGRALDYFRSRGATADLFVTESHEHLTRLARESSRLADRLVVAGGDGTVHHALRDLDLAHSVLGLLPSGSGDDFARALGIGESVEDSCETVLHGEIRRLDVALANDVRYIGVAGMGLDSEVARWVNENGRSLPRSMVYLYGVLRTLPAFTPKRIFIEVDGRQHEEEVMFAVVANNTRYGAGIEIAPTARMDDRKLDLHVIRRCSRWKLLRTMPLAYSGSHLNSGVVWWQQAESFRIDSDEPLEVFADGEYVTQTPVSFTLERTPLMVAAPRRD